MTNGADYSPGSAIYERLSAKYGDSGANEVWQAAVREENGQDGAINDALTRVKYGARLNDSTLSIFTDQIVTDPLGAPLESLNTALGNSVLSFLRNPWVLLAIAALIFYAIGGFGWLGRLLKGKLA